MTLDLFYKDITLTLCSTLNIEQGMQNALGILKTMMPAEALMLHFYDPRADTIRIIARATPTTALLENRHLDLPGKLDLVQEIKTLPRTGIYNSPGQNRLNDEIMTAYHMKGWSLLQMFLETKEQKYGLGHLTLCAKGENRYTRDHLNRFVRIREPFTIACINALHHLKILEARQNLEAENRVLKQAMGSGSSPDLVGEETGLSQVMTQASQVAVSSSIVLLTGETGVGKEVVANRIHSLSARGDRAFIKLNCGAIPDTLVDSEFFGHEKGAFSGAVATKPGVFEQAHQGTLFLDEVGELSSTAQVRLLRVLQNGIIQRVGGSRPIQTRVRIIAATNRDMQEMVRAGTFREDLWFRFNVFPINIPPLRHRIMDIPLLAHYFIREKSREMNLPVIPDLTKTALTRLTAYAWPGNVRELKNIIERSLILSQGPELDIPELGMEDSPPLSAPATREKDQRSRAKNNLPAPLDKVIKDHIEMVLTMTRGKIHGPGGAADLLKINAGTLRHRMNRLGILYGRKRKSRK